MEKTEIEVPIQEWFELMKFMNADISGVALLAKYKISWNDLMPVVEKIRKEILPVIHKTIPKHSATKGDLIDVDISCGFMTPDISVVYKHTLEFIKWFNQQSK